MTINVVSSKNVFVYYTMVIYCSQEIKSPSSCLYQNKVGHDADTLLIYLFGIGGSEGGENAEASSGWTTQVRPL